MPCSELGHQSHHLLVFNGGETILNNDDPRVIRSEADSNLYCVTNLNGSNSLAIVEYCETHLHNDSASDCERNLGCPNKLSTNLILFNSRTVICSGYNIGKSISNNTGVVVAAPC